MSRFLRRFFLFFVALSSISLFSVPMPIVNRYLPQLNHIPCCNEDKDSIFVDSHFFIGHGSQTFARKFDVGHEGRGIPEIWGDYDLKEIISSIEEYHNKVGSAYVSPYDREPGAHVWKAGSRILFEARSSIDFAGFGLSGVIPAGQNGVSFFFNVPFYSVETRDRYMYKPNQREIISIDDYDQLDRLLMMTHRDLGLDSKDWKRVQFGDVSCGVLYKQESDYFWLFRSVALSSSLAVGIPTGQCRDWDNPSSVPFGNDGHWAISAQLNPQVEIKEGIFLEMPTWLTLLTKERVRRRIPLYKEPRPYSKLYDDIWYKPGASLGVRPGIVLKHFPIPHLHVGLSLGYQRQFDGSEEDSLRTASTVPSYLTRQTVSGVSNDTLAKGMIANNIEYNKSFSRWYSFYWSLDAQYELYELFPGWKNVPTASLQVDYCFRGAKVARTHQITTKISWRF